MTNAAAALVANAKQWAGLYGDYPNGEEGAALTAPLRVRAAWERNDADGLADVFLQNGSMLVGDRQLISRKEIRAYMAEAFSGGLKGSRLSDEPREVRLLTPGVAVVVMDGGLIRDGSDEVAVADSARSMWTVVKQDGDWRVAAYQSSPVKG